VSADAAPACPVCLWPAAEQAPDCHNCGTRLLSHYVIGAPPSQAQQELDRAVADERRRYALRVAVRAAGWCGQDSLASLVRRADGDTPMSDVEIEDVRASYRAEEAPHPAAVGVGFTLSRLVAGDTDAIEFVEISPDGLGVYALVADELGVPGLQPGGQAQWTDILPELPADDELRIDLLAGGVGEQAALAGAALAASVAAAAEREIAGLVQAMTDSLRSAGPAAASGNDVGMALPPLARPDTVLVCRTRRWPPLEAAAARVRAVIRPVAEILAPGPGPLSAVLEETVRRAPLRYDYQLVLAAVDQRTGMVRLAPSLLFPAGTTGQPRVFPTRDIAVTAPSAAADLLVLPVVARRGDDPAGWPAVGVGAMDGTVVGHTQLRIRLEAPGWVSMSASPRLVRGDDAPGWPGVLDELPARVPAAVVADVVLLAELGGPPETVTHRMRLVDSVVGELDCAGVKVAVIGYREHWDKYPMPEGLIVGCGLGDADDVRPMLARDDMWQAVAIRDRHAAPLEDALDAVAQQDWGWRPGARHLLVVFGSRPPHPNRVDASGEGRASQCLNELSWPDILGRLRREHDVECMAVLPERAARASAGDYAEHAWAEFSAAGLFYAEQSPGADLVHAIGIDKPDEGARLPLAVSASDAWLESGPGREGSR
jgi:hypothetical protein